MKLSVSALLKDTIRRMKTIVCTYPPLWMCACFSSSWILIISIVLIWNWLRCFYFHNILTLLFMSYHVVKLTFGVMMSVIFLAILDFFLIWPRSRKRSEWFLAPLSLWTCTVDSRTNAVMHSLAITKHMLGIILEHSLWTVNAHGSRDHSACPRLNGLVLVNELWDCHKFWEENARN